MNAKNPHWDNLAYHRMSNVRIDNDTLVVVFEDGDRVTVPAGRLMPFDAGVPAWDALTWDPYEIQVPTSHGTVAVAWSTVRLLTDRDYATFVAAEARDYAVRMGARIRALRKARGLSSKELAQRAGIAPNSLSRIELGRYDVTLTALGSLVAAMGYSYADLVDPVEAPTPA
ncbi:MAG: helix-turn-helix domain-containing protein [Dehalococcoidia bacterium]